MHTPIIIFLLLIFTEAAKLNFVVTPEYNDSMRAIVGTYRSSLRFSAPSIACGILWTLATASENNGNEVSSLSNASDIGYYRTLSVAYEVLQSAGRVKHSVQMNGTLPSYCEGRLELMLLIDRSMMSHINGDSGGIFSTSVSCLFDKVRYFDELPLDKLPVSLNGNISEFTKRLSSRTNTLKVVALLSSPYMYTLYLDGDTAPCPSFPYDAFARLANADMFTTQNPFGFQSTDGNPLYPGAPDHASYQTFPEPNGGVMGFRWNARVERLWVRVVELIPYFHSLGYDQDQAFIRHALFEETRLHGLVVDVQPMRRYCRSGWNCGRNSCRAGCVVIHQRICLSNGINYNFTVSEGDRGQCGDVARGIFQQSARNGRGYHKALTLKKQQQRLIIH